MLVCLHPYVWEQARLPPKGMHFIDKLIRKQISNPLIYIPSTLWKPDWPLISISPSVPWGSLIDQQGLEGAKERSTGAAYPITLLFSDWGGVVSGYPWCTVITVCVCVLLSNQ